MDRIKYIASYLLVFIFLGFTPAIFWPKTQKQEPEPITYDSKAAEPVWDKIAFEREADSIDFVDDDTILIFGSISDNAIRFDFDN